MSEREPHAPYIAAVVAAANPDDYWTDSAETAPDGETITLTGLLQFGYHVAPEHWPHGLLILWSLHEGWQYAGLRADGTNDIPEPLPLALWAPPELVSDAALDLLAGNDPKPSGDEWDNQLVINACLPWLNED